VVVISVVGLLFAEAYGELFGIFDDEHALLTGGVADVVKTLTSPPTLESQNMQQSLAGALGLYYWYTFLVRLVLGSFTVAVLVGSFNETKGVLAKQRAASQSAPKGYAHLKRKSLFQKAVELGSLVNITHQLLGYIWYALTCRAHGTFAPRLHRHLMLHQHQSGTAGKQPHLTQDDLSAAFGRAATDRLMRRFGVVPLASEAAAAPSTHRRRTCQPSRTATSPVIKAQPSSDGDLSPPAAGEAVESHLRLLDQRVASVDERVAALCAGQEQLTTAITGIAEQLKLLSPPADAGRTHRRSR